MTGATTRRTLGRLTAGAACAGALVLTAGCSQPGTPGGASTGVPEPSSPAASGWFVYAGEQATGAEVPGPVDAVERAGLRLPARSDVRRVETQSAPLGAESYLFVFRIDAVTAADFCDEGGLGGAGPAPALPSEVAGRMHDPVITSGSRWCASPAPTDARWSRHVLIDAGDPATVHLALYRRP